MLIKLLWRSNREAKNLWICDIWSGGRFVPRLMLLYLCKVILWVAIFHEDARNLVDAGLFNGRN